MNLPQVFKELSDCGFSFDFKSLKYYTSGQAGPIYTLNQGKFPLLAKVFQQTDGYQRMTSEIEGLVLIKDTGTVNTPEIYYSDMLPSGSLLIMEFIEGNQFNLNQAMATLGRQLAHLHLAGTNDLFGLGRNNYIGSLIQSNDCHVNWSEFYFNRRLKPQIDLAVSSGLLPEDTIGNKEDWIKTIESTYPEEPPALIHGDLWSGNVIADHLSQPFLIDPAVSYNHREMDIAMSKLFGGFNEDFYAAYQEVYPLAPSWDDRLEMSQLYYLLVHVNLFGKSYVSRTRTLLRQYFG